MMAELFMLRLETIRGASKPATSTSRDIFASSRLGYPLFPLATDPQFPPRAENHHST